MYYITSAPVMFTIAVMKYHDNSKTKSYVMLTL